MQDTNSPPAPDPHAPPSEDSVPTAFARGGFIERRRRLARPVHRHAKDLHAESTPDAAADRVALMAGRIAAVIRRGPDGSPEMPRFDV